MALLNLQQERAKRTQPVAPNPLELPSDPDAEQACIGSILLNRDAIIAIKDWLLPERFYLAKHKQVYEAALALVVNGVPPDLRTIASELRVRGQLEGVGGIGYLTELVQAAPTAYHIAHYAESVDRTGWQRELIQAASKLVATAYANADQAAAEIEAITTVAANRRHHAVRIFHISELWSQQFPPLVTLAEGLLYEGVTLFSGKPKMGKSLLTVDIAAGVAAGTMVLGGVPVQGGPVLYLCLEDPTAALQERLESVLGSRSNIPLYYQMEWPPLNSGGLSAIQGWLADHSDAKLIVIDTLVAVAPAPDGKKTEYRADYDSLKPLQRIAANHPGLAIIVNTHSRKAGADDVLDEISGTTGKSGAVDHIWVMRRTRGDDEAELHIHPRRAASAVRQLTFNHARVGWSIGGDAEASKAGRIRREILETLADDDFWPNDIASYCDMDSDSGKAQVRKQLTKLLKSHLVEKADKGKYRITKLGRQEITSTSEQKDHGDQGIIGSAVETGFRGVPGFDSELSATQEPLIPDPLIPVIFSDETAKKAALAAKETAVQRILTPIKPDQRTNVRVWTNSYAAADQAKARAACERYGADYSGLYALIHGSAPPEPTD
jgi:hypothetical protein